MKGKKGFFISTVDFGMFLAAVATYVFAYMCRIMKFTWWHTIWDGFSCKFQSTILKFTSEMGFKLLHSFPLIFSHILSWRSYLNLLPNAMHKCEPGQGPLEKDTMGKNSVHIANKIKSSNVEHEIALHCTRTQRV